MQRNNLRNLKKCEGPTLGKSSSPKYSTFTKSSFIFEFKGKRFWFSTRIKMPKLEYSFCFVKDYLVAKYQCRE